MIPSGNGPWRNGTSFLPGEESHGYDIDDIVAVKALDQSSGLGATIPL